MIIFLHGADTYRSREKLRALTEKFRCEVDPSGTNLVTLDGATVTAGDCWGAIAAQSFLVRKRMVVVEDIGAAPVATREEISAFLDRIPEDVVVIFYESVGRKAGDGGANRVKRGAKKPATTKSTAASDPLFPKLLAGKYVEEFAPLAGAELAAWVRARAASLAVTLAPEAFALLVQEVGGDLWRMRNELDKLTAAAAAERATTITAAHVRALVLPTPPEDVFAFVDAVGSGNRVAALAALRALEAARVEPFPVVQLLARQCRLLLSTADLLDRGVAPHALVDELRVQPFVARKLAEQTRRHSMASLRALHARTVELDAQLKSSRATWEMLFGLFIFDVTEARA